jgi:hypothetical protein
MIIVTVKPTVHLTSYAINNADQMFFGPEDLAKNQKQEINIKVRKANWFTRLVIKIDQSQSTAGKIGSLILRVFLLLSIVGVPLIFVMNRIYKKNKMDQSKIQAAQELLNQQNSRFNKRAELLEMVNIQNFEQLPVLESDQELFSLSEEQLENPMMKGFDKDQHPFLAVKLKDLTDEQVFVAVLFQRFTASHDWSWKIQEGFQDRLNEFITDGFIQPRELNIFAEIIAGTHPKFCLAN